MTSRTLTLFGTLITLATGCGSSVDDKDASGGDADADEGADADADADADEGVDDSCEDEREIIACGESDGEATGSITGRLVNEAGEPYADAQLQLCTETQCRPTVTDGDGAWGYGEVASGCYALDAHHVEDHTTKVLTFIQLETGEDRVLDESIVLYQFDDETDISGETTVTAGDLQIMANSEGYDAPLAHQGGDIVESVQVDPATSGLPLDTVDGEVVGMWYLGPWDTKLDPGWGITTTGIEGITAGDTIQVLSGSYFGGMGWYIAGETTASADGEITLSNADCGGLPTLTTLLLVKK